MSDWEILRQQVAVCGIVSDAAGVPVAGAAVAVGQAVTGAREYTCVARADGSYFFTDLPDGAYRVRASVGSVLTKWSKAAVQRDKDGTLQIVRLDLVIGT